MSTQFNWYRSGRCLESSYSLIELLIVIMITAILFTLSVPSLHHQIQHARFLLLQHRLSQALASTRAFAMLHQQPLRLCGSQNGDQCDGYWTDYWRIERAVDGQLIRLFDIHMPSSALLWRGNHRQRSGIIFNKLGETMGTQGRFLLQLDHYCAETVLIASGRIRVVTL